MPGTATERAADREGLRPIREIYADRTYADSFNLTPRAAPGAMVDDPAKALRRVIDMVGERCIVSTSGKMLAVDIDSVCVHGDGPHAVAIAHALRDGLAAAGFEVRSALA